MSRSQIWLRGSSLATLSLFVVACSVAGGDNNDLTIGGSRATGMGGAGLALPIQPFENHDLNPAFLGYHGMNFDVYYPRLGFGVHGLTTKQLQDFGGNISSGGVESSNLDKYAKELGANTTQFNISAAAGLGLGNFAIDGAGVAAVTAIPNATLQGYAGGTSGTPPVGSRLDAYGIGSYSYGASWGASQKLSAGALSYGLTAKEVRAYYSHQYIQYGAAGTTSGPGDEMGGNNALDKNGIAGDLGFLFSPSQMQHQFFGMTLTNALTPNISFDREVPGANGNPILPGDVNVFKRQFNFGYGGVFGKSLVAVDLLDAGNAANVQSLALGAEQVIVPRLLSVRAGYNSRTAFTVGVSLFGVNIAYAQQMPLTATTGFKF